jgi:hypothetical protein
MKMSETKNILPYLEFHLTDHCNLNCKGCNHFCSIANENYLSMESFLKDMKRLSEIFLNITKIRIMGGEPLLHPLVTKFVQETRHFFPYSVISVATNGILLPEMDVHFYNSLFENNIILDLSIYPLTEKQLITYLELPIQRRIPIRFTRVSKFCKSINALGNSDALSMYIQCWVRNCTFLREGKIYHCCLPALSDIINRKFNLTIPNIGIDIHEDISGSEILNFISKPSPVCSYCSKTEWFPWEQSNQQKNEWLTCEK